MLDKSRAKSDIDPLEIKHIAFLGKTNYDYAVKASKIFSEIQEEVKGEEFFEVDRASQIKIAYRFLAASIKRKELNDIPVDVFKNIMGPTATLDFPGGVSDVMVVPLIEVLGNDEQQKIWLPLLKERKVTGAYCQTELSHGSDVQSLQTEAHYDSKKNVFVLNTPCLEATKWWPGDLTNLASIIVVFAQTFHEGKKLGVLPFLVRIRDEVAHTPLPGIEVGDIGPKFGYYSRENGFLRFSNFEVPKSSLLNRFIDISESGDLELLGDPKIIYAAMMKVRSMLIANSGFFIGFGASIAIRYSIKRTQFLDANKREIPVIEYQLQRFKLFPTIAKAYVISLAFIEIERFVLDMIAETDKGEFNKLQESHIYLSGGKAFYTAWVMKGLTTCMESCGGHGYSIFSGIPHLMYVSFANTILEGENTMISQQVGQFVLKQFSKLKKNRGEKIEGQASYLAEDNQISGNFEEAVRSVQVAKLFQKAALWLVEHIHESVKHLEHKKKKDAISSKLGIKLFELSKLHTLAFTIKFAYKTLEQCSHAPTKAAVHRLLQLFSVESLLECGALFLVSKTLNPKNFLTLREIQEELLNTIHPDAARLADGFSISESFPRSALSGEDDNPYQVLLERAKTLGQLNHHKDFLVQSYLENIRKTSVESFPNIKL